MTIKNADDQIGACSSFVEISHEKSEKLQAYVGLLSKWQTRINLVSANTLNDVWNRHIFDSIQLMKFVSHGNSIVDIGSGAGFPGLVLAIMGVDATLIESDQRKCSFMSTVARETGINIKIENKRIEDCEPRPCDFVTARALASLNELLGYASSYMGLGAKCLFLKGDNLSSELTFTNRLWHTRHQIFQSLSDKNGSVLLVEEALRKNDEYNA